ncbi:MAG: PEGA domain-containing protein, partial [Proteobacteria bacterium]|nr:PEGA domain-containing protein [Pseudomonadota bacterium]
MDRTTALRILGLPEDARVPEIRSAYWALRDHVEARAAASSAEDRPAREAELYALDALLAAASGAPSAPDARRRRVIPRPWLAGWALLATAATVALGLALLRAPGGAGAPPVLVDGAGAGSSGTGEAFAAEIERASLVARANMDGAGLEIATALDGDTVAAGPADDTTYAVAPGDYELRVSHPDCPDEWRRHLAVVAGEHHELSPQVCADTGFLVVRSNVEGDQLSIDGERLGGTGSDRHALRAGEHQVLVEKRGYAPWRGAVEIPP